MTKAVAASKGVIFPYFHYRKPFVAVSMVIFYCISSSHISLFTFRGGRLSNPRTLEEAREPLRATGCVEYSLGIEYILTLYHFHGIEYVPRTADTFFLFLVSPSYPICCAYIGYGTWLCPIIKFSYVSCFLFPVFWSLISVSNFPFVFYFIFLFGLVWHM